MKTKQIITAISILILGILIGKFAFSNATDNTNHQHENSVENWTCSMHPQIDLPEFGACPICGMDLIKKTTSDETVAENSFKMTKNAMALANIETLVVGSSKNSSSTINALRLSGKIQANEKSSSIQTAHFGGRIEHLNYKSIGEYVKQGSLLATVYSPELVTAQNEFIEALVIKNSQPELYKAVRNKLKNWKISETQITQIEYTKKVITNFKMYANVSGYIDEILVQDGNHVKEGMPLFKVSNLSTVWAVFDVYEQDIKNLKLGQKLIVKANAYPDKEITAKINFIDPNLNTDTRTVLVRATLSNSKKRLKPGMLLSGEVEFKNSATVKSSIVIIPKTAVLWTGKRAIVYIKTMKNEPVFELREIALGNVTETNYEVLSGLENGEEVVVNGTFTVDAAAQLQGKSSMMNRKINNNKLKDKSDDSVILNKVTNLKRIETNPKFKKQLNTVFKDYMSLKDAFVLTDAKKVSEKANQVLVDLKKVKMISMTIGKNSKEAQKILTKELAIIKEALQFIKNEEFVKNQRTAFINLSNAVIVLANSFGVEETIYMQHCPMANDNKGANWLSSEKEIRNPYFGDKMLKCGSVERIIN